MSSHHCFAPPFPLDTLMRPNDGAQEMAYLADNDYYPDGAYYYVETADD